MKPTTKLQLQSLDNFATELGYQYAGSYFESENGNKVSFRRMVELHNGKIYNHFWHVVVDRSKIKVKAGNEYIPEGLYEQARERRLVKQVKLQMKKGGMIITQSHMIEFA